MVVHTKVKKQFPGHHEQEEHWMRSNLRGREAVSIFSSRRRLPIFYFLLTYREFSLFCLPLSLSAAPFQSAARGESPPPPHRYATEWWYKVLWLTCKPFSFIHSGYFYSASSCALLLRGAPDYSIDTVSELTRRSATCNYEWRTCPKSLRGG